MATSEPKGPRIVHIALEPVGNDPATVIADYAPSDGPVPVFGTLGSIRIRFDQPLAPETVVSFHQDVEYGTAFSILVAPAIAEEESDAQTPTLQTGASPVHSWIAGTPFLKSNELVWRPRPGGLKGDPFDHQQPYVLFVSGWRARRGERVIDGLPPWPMNWPPLRALRSSGGADLDADREGETRVPSGDGTPGGLFVLPFVNRYTKAGWRKLHRNKRFVVVHPLPRTPRARLTVRIADVLDTWSRSVSSTPPLLRLLAKHHRRSRISTGPCTTVGSPTSTPMSRSMTSSSA